MKKLLNVVFFGVVLGMAANVQALDRRLGVVNNSSSVIKEMYMSNVGRNKWGRDRLGENTLDPGESGFIDLDDNSGYCRFDLKVVAEDFVATRQGVDICRASVWIINDEDNDIRY